ncbi:MAG: FAD-dependent oxidoreductase [Opitutaceae bacterium]|nr:FAD-dependent oxidoreductase [Verrucomicrobiales bacterium]
MKLRHFQFALALAVLLVADSTPGRAEVIQSDICIFGGTSGGIAAAIQAKRMGKSAVIVNPTKYLGGLTTAGLGATDIGNKAAVGGISREFYQRIAKHYSKDESWTLESRQDYFARRGGGQTAASNLTGPEATMWTFEPKVAERIYLEMLREASVPFYLDQRLAEVKKSGLHITEIVMENGNVFRAAIFIDATYEGDLLAKAGVSHHIGREANSVYGETLNGICAETPKHQFTAAVDPYVKPGDASSGLLPFIQAEPLGTPGDGDKAVQAYNYRLCFTTNAANRMRIVPPPTYDEREFELLGRYFEALVAAGKKPTLSQFWNPIWMPNGKTDINNNGGFSTDFIGANHRYPEADHPTRDKMAKDHEYYVRGFLTYLATSPRVPESIRNEMALWGPAKDEFPDTGGWPRELYVREARRMVSDYVMTENHCRRKIIAEDSISLAAYNMDSHNCRRIVRNGRVENEGDVQVPPMSPYPISYRSIIPKAKECDNLFAPVCLSSTHIAYGSIRMEPVFMILGQSAATAAVIAINEKIAVQKVPYTKLRERLLADKQILDWKLTPEQEQRTKSASKPQTPLTGIVLDDRDGQASGDWAESSSLSWRVGSGYLHDGNANKGHASMTFTPNIPRAGDYEILLITSPASNRASNVPVTVRVADGETKTVKINQKLTDNGGVHSLGKFSLPKGLTTRVIVSNEGTDGHVVVDGLQVLPVK